VTTQTKGVDEKAKGEEVIRLLAEIKEILKENNDILKSDHEIILSLAEDVRKIRFNTQ